MEEKKNKIGSRILMDGEHIEVTFIGNREVMQGFVKAALDLAFPDGYKGFDKPPK